MDKIIVLDFGGQYSHLISRRVRDFGVYSVVLPSGTPREELARISGIKGLILSGGAASVYDKHSPKCDREILGLGVPVLGICYGHQLIAHLEGGEVVPGESGEYGITELSVLKRSSLLNGLKSTERVWMNHRDIVKSMPRGYSLTASTRISPIAAFEDNKKNIYGVQFHPEVTHTENGDRILRNFVFQICKSRREWSTSNIIDSIISEARQRIGNRKAIIGLSGGVDSSTAAVLVNRSIGSNMTAVYVDTGLMREGETEFIKRVFLGGRYDTVSYTHLTLPTKA